MNDKQKQLPLFNTLVKHQQQDPISFHVPGHKNGTVFPSEGLGLYESILRIDATELSGLDDLHDPTGPIKESEKLASDFYGAKDSFFLVGGSTVGNMAMILSVCSEGDTVLVQRNSHKSILNGLKLAKANPIFLNPLIDEQSRTAIGLTDDTVSKAIEAYPNTKALMITNPSYYGLTIDLKKIIEIAHKYHIPVFVDEAHGAHFGIGEPFPRSAIEAGADLVVQSSHKTLPAMTMGSILHYNSCLVPKEKVKYYLQVLQSSSPSYPIMASLDLARYYLAQLKEEQIITIANDIKTFRTNLNTIPQISVVQAEESYYTIDPLKITIQSRCELSGYQLQALLESEGIFTELADPVNVLMVMPLKVFSDDFRLINKIKQLLSCYTPMMKLVVMKQFNKEMSSLSLPFNKLVDFQSKRVPLKKAVGMVVAEDIIPYPPGIPIVIAGERLEYEVASHLEELITAGASFQGELFITEGIKVFTDIEKSQHS